MRHRRFMVLIAFFFTAALQAQEPVKKFLLIGIDGCRTDALLAAHAPHMHGLIKEGAFSDKNDVLGDKESGVDTVSAPGWTTMLTGVWADKHGVKDNGFSAGNSKRATFLARLHGVRRVETVAFVTWKALFERVFLPGEGARYLLDGGTNGFPKADQVVAERVVKCLAEEDPTALFLFFGQVDQEGHKNCFHPKVKEYTRAIERVDGHVGELLAAMRKRANYAKEDWLVVIGTDHGGRGTGHFRGRHHEEVRWTFLILHGPSVAPGKIRDKTANVDVAVTALEHLGAPVQAEWSLDGRRIGLK